MSGRPNGNGNGRGGRKNGGGGGDVPRWVRGLFDKHERRMDEFKREHEEHVERMAEMKAEHEERMAAHEARMAAHEVRMAKMDRQTFALTGIVGRLEKDHAALVQLVREVHGRVARLETPGRKG